MNSWASVATADGATWRPVLSDLRYYGWVELVAVCSSSTSTVWLGRADGTVSTVCAVGAAWGIMPARAAGIVSNGGAWSRMTFHIKSGAPAQPIGDVEMLTAKVGLALGGGNKVFKTVDGGVNWQQQ